VKTTFALAFAALVAAVNVTCSGVPGVTVILLGDTETSAGIPVSCTVTCDEKPFSAVADRETEAELPASTD
jgi:hypothetical protein